jgi:hypothetical protein
MWQMDLQAANGDKMRQVFESRCDKLRQVCCRLLSLFAAHFHSTFFGVTNRKGMLSSKNCPQIRARRTRDIRVEPMFVNSNQRIRWLPCARIQNSIVCRRSSRQSIARLIRLRSTLHPPPGSVSFAFRISRTRGFSLKSNYLESMAHLLKL